MKKVVLIVIFLNLIFSMFASQEDKKRVASFKFTMENIPENQNAVDLDLYANTIADAVVENMLNENIDEYMFLERNEKIVANLLGEIDFQASGITKEQVADYGLQSTAEYVLSGSVVYVENSYLVKAQLIHVDTAVIVASATVSTDSLVATTDIEVAKSLAKTLNNQVNIYNSILMKEEETIAIAINPFTGSSINSSATGDVYSSLFVTELINGKYTVLGREATVNRILDEGSYQAEGLTQTEGGIEYGQREATTYLLTGEVDEIDRGLSISLKVVNVNTSELICLLTLNNISSIKNQIVLNNEIRKEIYNYIDDSFHKRKTDREKIDSLLEKTSNFKPVETVAKNQKNVEIISQKDLLKSQENLQKGRTAVRYLGYIGGGITTLYFATDSILNGSELSIPLLNIQGSQDNLESSFRGLGIGVAVVATAAIIDIILLSNIIRIDTELNEMAKLNVGFDVDLKENENRIAYGINTSIKLKL